jgi:phytoene/squalene synthetase
VSLDACAALVARGDPDRYAALLAAPVAARARLLPLYAFNLEVARAPWVTQEPMIAEMRLQFWRDVVEGAASGSPQRAHEVAGPMADLIRAADLPIDVLDRLIDARRHDIDRAPFADQAALDAYLEDTGGGLMWLAARALGAGAEVEPLARKAGWATGLAAYLRAVPELEARGRVPLVDGRPEAVADLAREALARLDAVRRSRGRVPATVRPAFFPARAAGAILRQAAREPGRVATGALAQPELARRGGLLCLSLTGRW